METIIILAVLFVVFMCLLACALRVMRVSLGLVLNGAAFVVIAVFVLKVLEALQ